MIKRLFNKIKDYFKPEYSEFCLYAWEDEDIVGIAHEDKFKQMNPIYTSCVYIRGHKDGSITTGVFPNDKEV